MLELKADEGSSIFKMTIFRNISLADNSSRLRETVSVAYGVS